MPPPLTSKQLAEALHEALRGGKPLGKKIKKLFLYRRYIQSPDYHGDSPSSFIQYCLDRFQIENPQEAKLLSQRFVEKEAIKSLAARLSLSQEQVNRQQKAAIQALAEWVLVQEERKKQEAKLLLINSLVSPSYTRLFGAEKIVSSLIDLLQPSQAPLLIALVGLGGVGKTALADWVLRALIPTFPYEQIVWLQMGREGQPMQKEQLLGQLCARLITEPVAFADQFAELHKYMKAHPCLIVLDDLDTQLADLELVDFLQDLANPSKFLLTSRRLPNPLAQVYVVPIKELTLKPALELLMYEANQRGMQNVRTDLRANIGNIYARTGGHPLALRLVAGLLQTWSLPTVLASLQAGAAGDVEKMYASIFEKSWQALTESGQGTLLSMLHVDTEGANEQHLLAISELKETNLRRAIFELRQSSLLEMRGSILEPRYGVHHLTETFLRNLIRLRSVEFQTTFEAGGHANLLYWVNMLRTESRIEILKNEKGNLKRAVKFGFEKPETQLTCQLLDYLFPAILELGVAPEWIKDFQQAIAWKTEVKTSAALLYQLGAFHWQLGETRNALGAFGESVKLAKQHSLRRQEAAAQLGICLSYWLCKDYPNAWQAAQNIRELLSTLDETDPLQVRGLSIQGIAAFAVEDYSFAISFFQNALIKLQAGAETTRAQLDLNLGLSLQAIGDFGNALKSYNSAAALLRSRPKSEKYLASVEILRASLHYQEKKMRAAKAALERAARLLQMDKNDVEIFALLESQLGRVHFQAGETEKAISFLGSAAKLWGQLGNSWMLTDTLEALEAVHEKQKRPG